VNSGGSVVRKRFKIKALLFPILAPLFLIGWALCKLDSKQPKKVRVNKGEE
jgi:hypothetical protein